MTLFILNIRCFILVCLFTPVVTAFAQDSTLTFTFDSSFLTTVLAESVRAQPIFNYIYHSPDKTDEQRFKKHKSLIVQQPTLKNHELFFSLACSLWQLEKIKEAEQMFLTIMNSTEQYYTSACDHSSDISGDKTVNIYGYGSYESNYKNAAAIYLTKIYIEQRRFDKALQFLEDAVKKYKVICTCGTGFQRQQDEYDFLYASCYEGLSRHEEVINLLLPSCLERNDEIIIAAIKKTYSQKEIQMHLQKAERSIECSLNTFPSYSYQTWNYGTKEEKTDTIKYFSGSATIILFERKINMPVPNLENGEHLTKDHFIQLLKETGFYIKLKDDK